MEITTACARGRGRPVPRGQDRYRLRTGDSKQAITRMIEGGRERSSSTSPASRISAAAASGCCWPRQSGCGSPGDRFGLCCLSPDVLKIIRLTGFTSIFSIYPSEGEALAAW